MVLTYLATSFQFPCPNCSSPSSSCRSSLADQSLPRGEKSPLSRNLC